MFGFSDDKEYDYDLLRRDLENEYGAQGIAFSGGFGFMEMIEASGASEKDLLKMARDEGIDLREYEKKGGM